MERNSYEDTYGQLDSLTEDMEENPLADLAEASGHNLSLKYLKHMSGEQQQLVE